MQRHRTVTMKSQHRAVAVVQSVKRLKPKVWAKAERLSHDCHKFVTSLSRRRRQTVINCI
jgi:hypothetical protein